MNGRSCLVKMIMGTFLITSLFCGCGNAGRDGNGLARFSAGNGEESLGVAGQGTAGEKPESADSLEAKQVSTAQKTYSAGDPAGLEIAQGILPEEMQLRAELEMLFQGLYVKEENPEKKTSVIVKQGEDSERMENPQKITGIYGLNRYNAYPKNALTQFYGEGFAERIPCFELRGDGTGTLWDNGDSLDFSFDFDDNGICMFREEGAILFEREGAELFLYDQEGNAYGFSLYKMK